MVTRLLLLFEESGLGLARTSIGTIIGRNRWVKDENIPEFGFMSLQK